ncbi:hypothetical protein Pint_12904 [Pistacia integerrima]|uniref:Uncharacterized protein n=1 Tax=Pistacia integerrima TaxID=434235 RepID=A0ACC0Y969_9ROSI|nr:hypothetical protein Pint_12904 [Pistacia integerrima]
MSGVWACTGILPISSESYRKEPRKDSSKVPQGDKEGFVKVNHKGKGKADLKPLVDVSSANQIVISSNPIGCRSFKDCQ